jgi:FixJ family two-component response regulator
MRPAQQELTVSSTKGVVVHVIDDDIDVRRGFSRLLRSAGREVRDYNSAELFLDAIDDAAPGCILLDVTMPGINGPEMLARLNEKQSSLPVIVVSARDNESIHTMVRALGARMFLRKPVDDQALLDAIDWVTQARADR